MNYNFIQILFLVIFVIHIKINAEKVSVTTNNGIVNGFTQTFNSTRVDTYLGIPYAEPPVGHLRFRKPLPAKNWSEPLDAYKWSPACYQNNPSINRSEDCLYLNVFVPKPNATDNALKPVIVWIYGGAFVVGRSSEPVYNPIVLTTRGDVIFVSINYRLAFLGLFYSGSDDAPGNTLLWDQTLALQWIKTNIGHFGGDSNQITISGVSAGSVSVSSHILSPVSRHLFQNAIMMSGSALISSFVEKPKTALKYWLRQSKSIGCGDESDDKFTPKIIDCLRKVPADKTSQIPYSPFGEGVDNYGIVPMFIVDGKFFTKDPLEMLNTGDFKTNVNLIIGNTQDEGSLLLWSLVDNVTFSPTSPKNFTYNEAFDKLKTMSSELSLSKPIDGELVSKMYFTGLSTQTDRKYLIREIGIAFGDYLMTCPTINFAKTLFKSDKNNSKVYQYYFNSKLGPPKFPCPDWMGVCHAQDLSPVFGLPFINPKDYLDRERHISSQMIDSFIHFAKYGNPGVIDGSQWPQYYSIGDNTIAPYYEFTNEPKSITNFNVGLKIDECDYLWTLHNF